MEDYYTLEMLLYKWHYIYTNTADMAMPAIDSVPPVTKAEYLSAGGTGLLPGKGQPCIGVRTVHKVHSTHSTHSTQYIQYIYLGLRRTHVYSTRIYIHSKLREME